MRRRVGEAGFLGEDSWVAGAGDPPDIMLLWSFAWDSVESPPPRPQIRELAVQERDKGRGAVCAESGWAESLSWRPQSTLRD